MKMIFSKKEKELLEHIRDKNWEWLEEHFAWETRVNNKTPIDIVRKKNYYSKLKSSIKRKVNLMEKDLEFYNSLKEIPWADKGYIFY